MHLRVIGGYEGGATASTLTAMFALLPPLLTSKRDKADRAFVDKIDRRRTDERNTGEAVFFEQD